MVIRLDRYPKGKTRAVTFSYDDAKEADYKLVEMFNKYGAVGTFNIDSKHIGEAHRVKEEDVKTLYKGHEVASHMYTHPFPHMLSMNELRNEVIFDREKLEHLTGQIVRGMAYPFGAYTDEVVETLPSLGIEYSRTTKSHKTMALPKNFLEWHPTCHHKDALECVNSFNDVRWNRLSLFYIWGHSYELEDNSDWGMMEELLKRICGLDDVWYASNIDIMDYIKALSALKFGTDSKTVYNPSCVTVWIEADGEAVKIEPGYNRI